MMALGWKDAAISVAIAVAAVSFIGVVAAYWLASSPKPDRGPSSHGLPVVRACTNGMYVWEQADGSYIAGYPNPHYTRSYVPANVKPEEFCL